MKGKLPSFDIDTPSGAVQSQYTDAFLALESLGFVKKDIESVFESLPENMNNADDEALIKWGLSQLG